MESELSARAAEGWLEIQEGQGVTDAIDRALTELPADHQLTDAAAAALASPTPPVIL